MVKGIFIAFFCGILLFIIHSIILVFRKKPRQYLSPIHQVLEIVRLLFKVCSALVISYTILYLFIPDNFFDNAAIACFGSLNIFSFLYGIILYIFLFVLYLTFYFLVDRSVSATIMINIENAPGKRLPLEEIERIYGIDKKYLHELKGMREGKFIVEESGYFRTSAKGRLYARVCGLLKNYFKLGPGG